MNSFPSRVPLSSNIVSVEIRPRVAGCGIGWIIVLSGVRCCLIIDKRQCTLDITLTRPKVKITPEVQQFQSQYIYILLKLTYHTCMLLYRVYTDSSNTEFNIPNFAHNSQIKWKKPPQMRKFIYAMPICSFLSWFSLCERTYRSKRSRCKHFYVKSEYIKWTIFITRLSLMSYVRT